MNTEHRDTTDISAANQASAETGEPSICAGDPEETEELAMGALSGAREARARAHLAICAVCRQEHDMLVAERALFERRAGALRPPRALEPSVLAAVTTAAEAKSSRRASLASATRIVFGLAACVTALIGNGWLDRGSPAMSSVSRSSESMTTLSSFDEPLACALPVSGFVHVSDRGAACAGPTRATRARGGDFASVASADRAICEDEVTSSFATP